jgi:hypothetical protein
VQGKKMTRNRNWLVTSWVQKPGLVFGKKISGKLEVNK